MGSRTAWKVVTSNDAAVWLYSHWGGDTKFEDTQIALREAMPRWGDVSYAARIFISQVIGEAWSGELGYGISATSLDADSPFEESYFPLTVDFRTNLVFSGEHAWTFDEFLDLENLGAQLAEDYWKVGA